MRPGGDFPARCLHAGFDIRSIIRQIIIAFELPDFRNLGVILRVALSVNALAAVAALVREPQLDLWTAQWLTWIAAVEPQLIIELAVLYALAPWLARQSYATGALVIAALTVGVGTVMDAHEVIILVSGHSKARALQKMVEEGVNHMWTVSQMQLHRHGMIVCDDESTYELKVGTVRYFKDIESEHLALPQL